MKYIVLLGDGMADHPIPELGGLTPLQAARTPNMDKLAAEGRSGMLATVPEGFAPGSEIANLMVLGYDPAKVFEGRGSLEAAGMGIEIGPDEMAMRCNLICVEDGKIKNHSAGHISTEEARELMLFLQAELGDGRVTFFPGVSYRHLLTVRGGDKRLICTPPHDVPGTDFRNVMIRPMEGAQPQPGKMTPQQTADFLNDLVIRSQQILENHPVNLRRKAGGKDAANSIWPWSPGYRPAMETIIERYGLKSGVVITAVDLIKGIGVYAGLKPVEVEGATGLYNTNYRGKAQAAIDALRDNNFVFVHVEASDEAGHEGDFKLKVRTIEDFDQKVVGPVMEAAAAMTAQGDPVSVAVLPDHPTPCHLKTHTREEIPFIIHDPRQTPDGVSKYDEFSAREGSLGHLVGAGFMDTLIADKLSK